MRYSALLLALSLLVPDVASAADPAPAPPSGHALGIGEPREPERFTLELRYLQAARDGDRKSIEFALARGVAVGTRDDLGRSALLLATHDAGSLDLVKLLHARGAEIDEPDVGGRAAISWAAADGRIEILRWLAAAGAAIDRKDVEQRTPLFHAVSTEQLEAVEFLLDHGAKPNTPDHYGDTPLILACSKGYDALAELLLRRGADATLRNQEGKTAADRAAPGANMCREAGALQTPR
jgi:ankyrin repeat protein